MKSMTGFSHLETTKDNFSVSIDIKSYNSRFLELNINIPNYLSSFEFKIRDIVSKRILRGKTEVSIKIKELEVPIKVTCNSSAVSEYSKVIKQVAKLANQKCDEIPLSLILQQDGVLTNEHLIDTDSLWKIILPLLEKTFDDFEKSRVKEGEALKKDILSMIEKLDKCSDVIKNYIPQMEQTFKDNLRSRFIDLLGDKVDEQRILQETAALLVKYTINEEIARLNAHLSSLKNEINNNPAPGRKIDFICQEINREINTIGSKNQNLEVGQIVIEAKDALENIREQSRNIE